MNTELNGRRILVVEDDYLVASLIQDVLEAAGCVVSGPIPRLPQAVGVAEADTCDAAVLDVNLGGNQVFPVAEVLSRRQIPFVFVTGYGPATLPDEHHDRPMIRKPFRIDELLSVVADLVKPAEPAE
jgi:DNA-binding response OmpR family regulator